MTAASSDATPGKPGVVIDRIAYSAYGEATRTLRSDVNGDGFVNKDDYNGVIRSRLKQGRRAASSSLPGQSHARRSAMHSVKSRNPTRFAAHVSPAPRAAIAIVLGGLLACKSERRRSRVPPVGRINAACVLMFVVWFAGCGTEAEKQTEAQASVSLGTYAPIRRDEQRDPNGILIVSCFEGSVLRETTWFLPSGRPLMRTDWLDCGYGHIFEFTSSGQLSGVFEARRGTRNGAGVHVAEDGSVAKLLWFLDGKSVDRPAEEVPEVLRGVDTTDLVVRKTPLDGSAGLWRQDYMRKNGSQVASITFDGRGRVLTAVKIGSLGRACIPRWRSDKLNSLANVRFDVWDGLALYRSETHGWSTTMYIRGWPFQLTYGYPPGSPAAQTEP
jgi:hypothetical protein